MDNNPVYFTDPNGDYINDDLLKGDKIYDDVQKITYYLWKNHSGYDKIIGIANHSKIEYKLKPIGGTSAGASMPSGATTIEFGIPEIDMMGNVTRYIMLADEYTHMAQNDFYSKSGIMRNTLQDEVESKLIMAVGFSTEDGKYYGADEKAGVIHDALGKDLIEQIRSGGIEDFTDDQNILLNETLNKVADMYMNDPAYNEYVKDDVKTYKDSDDKIEFVKEVFKK